MSPGLWSSFSFKASMARQVSLSFSHHTAWTLTLPPPSSIFKDACDYIRPTWISKTSPYFKVSSLATLISSATWILCCHGANFFTGSGD